MTVDGGMSALSVTSLNLSLRKKHLMTKQTKQLINPNLIVLCIEAQELIQEGYVFSEGYPSLVGWQYHAVLEKDVEDVPVVPTEAKKPGRPRINN